MDTERTRRDLTGEERMRLKTKLIGDRASNALAFETRATKKFGPAAGIMLRQLIFLGRP